MSGASAAAAAAAATATIAAAAAGTAAEQNLHPAFCHNPERNKWSGPRPEPSIII